jgi:hypothetical protein
MLGERSVQHFACVFSLKTVATTATKRHKLDAINDRHFAVWRGGSAINLFDISLERDSGVSVVDFFAATITSRVHI